MSKPWKLIKYLSTIEWINGVIVIQTLQQWDEIYKSRNGIAESHKFNVEWKMNTKNASCVILFIYSVKTDQWFRSHDCGYPFMGPDRKDTREVFLRCGQNSISWFPCYLHRYIQFVKFILITLPPLLIISTAVKGNHLEFTPNHISALLKTYASHNASFDLTHTWL